MSQTKKKLGLIFSNPQKRLVIFTKSNSLRSHSEVTLSTQIIKSTEARERSLNSLCFNLSNTEKKMWEDLVSEINQSICVASENGRRHIRYLIPISQTTRFKSLIIMMLGLNGYSVEISDAANALIIRW